MTATQTTILVIEDDPGLQKQLRWGLDEFEVLVAENREAALVELRRHEPGVVIQDLGLPPDASGVGEGMRCLSEIVELAPHTKVIVVTGHGDQENAVRAIAAGAYDFYPKPIDIELLKLVIRRASYIRELEIQNKRLIDSVRNSPLDGLIATSAPMLKVCELVEKIAPTIATVLLLGESGTGKEILAQSIHKLSDRADKRFVAINCAAIPETLLESELFGYEKGAFTGAARQTPGKIEYASGGTLFLDEIGDMPLSLQAKLLRFLQERVVERLGGRKEIAVDVRVVCATNQDLEVLASRDLFRKDLFYRVSEITINIPPLRDRDQDKIVIARYLLEMMLAKHGKQPKSFAASAASAISTYEWPGNVREMENKINAAVIVSDSKLLSAEDLGLQEEPDSMLSLNLREVRCEAESKAIRMAMEIAGTNVSKAAKLLGITRPTLYSLMERYGIESRE